MVPASSQHYRVTSGEIVISQPITIEGAGASSSVIDASGCGCRVFHVQTPSGNSTVTFEGVTIIGGSATTAPGGGAVLVDSVASSNHDLAFVNSVISGNSANVTSSSCCLGGGAIYNNGGAVSLTGSAVTNNMLTLNAGSGSCCDGGGAVYDNGHVGPITLNDSFVTHNMVNQTSTDVCCNGGGGVYDDGGSANSPITILSGSQVSNNAFTLNGPSTDAASDCCSGGGGIYQDNNTDVSVQNSAINGNSATVNTGECCHGGGGIYMDVSDSSGTGLSVSGSTLSGNVATVNGPSGNNFGEHCCSGGGAVASFGFINLLGSTLDSNTSSVTAGDTEQGGGAIQLDSDHRRVTANASTISNNRSLVSGATESGGGGVFESTSSTPPGSTYTNSTISGNSTNAAGATQGGGGIYIASGATTNPDVFANATIAGNSAPSGSGGGIFNQGSGLSSKNSIIALNSAAAGADCGGTGTTAFTSLGYNLTDSPDTCSFTGTGDKVVPASSVGLGPLANNGGPTQTRALLAGSPAIDAGNPAGCTDPSGALLTTDQRGFSRPFGPRCDIGAFEYRPAAVCTLKAKSNKVLLHPKKKQKKLKGRLQLVLVCNQAATVMLSGKLTVKSGKGRHKKTKTFKLSLTKSVTAGNAVTILLALPKKALKAISHKAKGSITFSLAATNTNGIGTATLKISKLKVKKH